MLPYRGKIQLGDRSGTFFPVFFIAPRERARSLRDQFKSI